MLSSLKSSKFARVASVSVVLGATAAFMFLGAPADAAVLGRGI